MKWPVADIPASATERRSLVGCRRDGVRLFDEADSPLFDQRQARASWEVGQVNEMLIWLDLHPLPVVAATNHPDNWVRPPCAAFSSS